MYQIFSVIALTIIVAMVGACSRPASSAGSDSPPDVRPIDACSLLNAEDIRSVQGEAVTQQKPSGNDPTSQCYFATTTPVNSVVVTVTRLADTAKQARPYWEKMFQTQGDAESERDKAATDRDKAAGEKEEQERGRPQEVDGVGEAAFWIGNRFGGAFYVLKANRYVRISVGGADDQAAKIKKSKALAEIALKRL